jgi:hypothetical protein
MSNRVAIDYHSMRVALRSGMVRIVDPDLAGRLRRQADVSAAEDAAVRLAVRQACRLLIDGSRHDVFAVDNILWMIGRNCCFYDYDPICGERSCWRQDQCSLVRAIGFMAQRRHLRMPAAPAAPLRRRLRRQPRSRARPSGDPPGTPSSTRPGTHPGIVAPGHSPRGAGPILNLENRAR